MAEHALTAGLDEIVEAFEAAQAAGGAVEVASFLPPPDHPEYDAVLRELVRVDLEYGWKRGAARPLEEYHRQFPRLFADPAGARDVAFEEYRQRRQAGERVAPAEYAGRFGIDTSSWPDLPVGPPTIKEGGESDEATEVALPQVGDEFCGFRLIGELGRGAFGRVFLARQGGLADRPVALKVSGELFGESEHLARLQHTNIVPIHSVHHVGRLQAVCMPFFGATTLADVLRELRGRRSLPESGKALVATLRSLSDRTKSEVAIPPGSTVGPSAVQAAGAGAGDFVLSPAAGAASPAATVDGAASARPEPPALPSDLRTLTGLDYVQAALWIAARLADGLAHAHERGILHRDLKPANVLITDEGRPMLLDFNLAADVGRAHASAALLGGTLPYMAPEHLEAFQGARRAVDARSDVYSLGVLLFELLTGELPYAAPRGSLRTVLEQMTADRRRPAPDVRTLNAAVSPAVASIVRHCLEPDPARRYASARALQEDIERHLAALPLRHAPEPSLRERFRKWRRRHPRLASSTSVGALAACALLAAVFLVRVHQQRALAREASDTLAQFREERQLAQTLMLKTLTGDQERLDEAIAAARRGLDRFQALSDAEWFNRPAVLRLPEVEREDLRREVADLRQLFQKGTELFDERERFHRRLEAVDTLKQFRDEWRAGQLALLDGLGGPAASADGLALCRRALDRYHVLDDPHWTDLPVVRRLPEDQQAELREELGELLLLLARVGLVNKTRDGSAEGAEARLREALRLNRLAETCYPPDRVPGVVWRQRAELLKALGDEPAARAVQARAEATPPQTVRALCLLAGEHLSRGRYREALPLLEDATRREPQNFWAWFDLGLCHDGLFQYADAVACYNTCQALWPRPQGVAFRRGVAELQLRRFAAARADFDQVLAAHPDFPEGYINRGLASLGLDRPAEALADLDKALGLGTVHTRAFFIRARIKDRLGDADGARRDREEGLRRPPNDERGWTTRALARLPGDPAAALADVEQALALNPQFLEGLQNKAHVLAEFLHRTDEAVAVLDRLIELYPDYVPARAGRGVLLARLGKRAAAHADAEQSLFRDTQASTLYQVAGVYALTSREVATDRLRAFELLSAALRQGYGFDLIDTDPDLAPIRELPEFQRLVAAARTLQAK